MEHEENLYNFLSQALLLISCSQVLKDDASLYFSLNGLENSRQVTNSDQINTEGSGTISITGSVPQTKEFRLPGNNAIVFDNLVSGDIIVITVNYTTTSGDKYTGTSSIILQQGSNAATVNLHKINSAPPPHPEPQPSDPDPDPVPDEPEVQKGTVNITCRVSSTSSSAPRVISASIVMSLNGNEVKYNPRSDLNDYSRQFTISVPNVEYGTYLVEATVSTPRGIFTGRRTDVIINKQETDITISVN